MIIISGSLSSQELHDQPVVINGVAVPSDFPLFIPSIHKETAPGYIFITSLEEPYYIMILKNDGTPYFYQREKFSSHDFKVQPDNLLSRRAEWGVVGFIVMDSNFVNIDSLVCQNGYGTDGHGFQLLPNGHSLLIAIDSRRMDLSGIAPNGNPDATVIGNHVQELDENHHVVFEWICWDHYKLQDSYSFDPELAQIDLVHMNSVAVDYDGNILVSSRNLSECTKIDRETGEIIWRLGGKNNQFDFINDPEQISYQHDIRPVEGNPNHYTIFDNGRDKEPQYSRAVEFHLDTENMIAEKVWEYRCDPDKYAFQMGNVQRLPNGNSLINWADPLLPKATEVTPEGEIVYEADFENEMRNYRTFRFEWDGYILSPYLIAEPFSDRIRLIFNKFGDRGVNYYNIYGGKDEEQLEWIDSTSNTWMDLVDLESLTYYNFMVTAVDTAGKESSPSAVETVFSRNIIRGENLVLNGDFSAGEEYWELYNGGRASSTGIITDSMYRFEIDAAGSDEDHIRLYQKDIPLVSGTEYVLEFEARADSPRLIEIMMEKNGSPYTNYSKTSSIYITQQFSRFQFPFVMEDPTDLKSRLVIRAGKSDVDFEIMDISLKEEVEIGTYIQVHSYNEIRYHPNPADNAVNLSFELRTASKISIQLYSLTGQLIETVSQGVRLPGSHEISVNTEKLASGLYMLRMNDGSTLHSTVIIVQH